GYWCNCTGGYYGYHCEYTHDLCNSTYDGYCQNNGTCFDHEENGPLCKCPVGFHGSNCEFTGKVYCSFPCENGGWCIQESSGFVCRCRLGYIGDRCQFSE
ncbi:hypothetical protein CAPTEDRAFT_125029, partial [Capitella teleta]